MDPAEGPVGGSEGDLTISMCKKKQKLPTRTNRNDLLGGRSKGNVVGSQGSGRE